MSGPLAGIERELACQRPYADFRSVSDRAFSYYLRGLGILGQREPAAGSLADSLRAAPDPRRLAVLGDPVIRVAINDGLEAVKRGTCDANGRGEILTDARMHLLSSRSGPPTAPCSPAWPARDSFALGTAIWCPEEHAALLAGRFAALFTEEIAGSVSSRPAILRAPGTALAGHLERGKELLTRLLPTLSRSVLAHVSVVAVVDTADRSQWSRRTRPNLCQNVSTHAIPATIFLSPTPLSGPWLAAEALLHEAAHKKLSDLVLTRPIFRTGFDSSTAPTVSALWNRDLSWNPAAWSADRALFAFHVYVHLALFFASVDLHRERLAEEFGDPPSNFAVGLDRALDRASYLGRHLADGLRPALGSDGRELVAWLTAVAERFERPEAADRVDLRLLMDRYDLETAEVARLIRNAPSSDPGAMRLADHLVHSEIVAAYRALGILGEREPPQFPFYDGDGWADRAPSAATPESRAKLFEALRQFVSATLRAAPPGALGMEYRTRRAKTLRDHVQDMVEHCGRHREQLEAAIRAERAKRRQQRKSDGESGDMA